MHKEHPHISVLHVATAQSWRGGEQQVAYLVEELHKKGIRQYVLCTEGSAMREYCIMEGIPYFSAPKRSSLDFFFARKIYSLCRQNNIGLIHVHDSHAHTFAVLAAAAGNRSRIIVSRRVDFPVGGNFFSAYKYNHSSVARILCVSDTIRQIMLRTVRDPQKLVTVHSGTDVSRFRDKTNSGILHSQYNLAPQVKIVGNVSALAPHKDYPTFIKTAKRLHERNAGIRFFIIGGGPEEANIRQLIDAGGLNEVVIMTGFRGDIPDILPELDVMLITSETEGLGTTILDAFACGVPVVATAAGGIPEMVVHGKTGLLADVRDDRTLEQHVTDVLLDEALRGRIVTNARQLLHAFSKEATAAKTLTEYLAVTGTPL